MGMERGRELGGETIVLKLFVVEISPKSSNASVWLQAPGTLASRELPPRATLAAMGLVGLHCEVSRGLHRILAASRGAWGGTSLCRMAPWACLSLAPRPCTEAMDVGRVSLHVAPMPNAGRSKAGAHEGAES